MTEKCNFCFPISFTVFAPPPPLKHALPPAGRRGFLLFLKCEEEEEEEEEEEGGLYLHFPHVRGTIKLFLSLSQPPMKRNFWENGARAFLPRLLRFFPLPHEEETFDSARLISTFLPRKFNESEVFYSDPSIN